jgi:hypothetical protein
MPFILIGLAVILLATVGCILYRIYKHKSSGDAE